MDWRTLIQLSNGKELHVFLVMAPEDVVSPQWIAQATNTSTPTVSAALKRLIGWMLVDRLTTQKYRLTQPGRTLAMQVAAVLVTSYDKQLSTGHPQDIHRYVLDAVGLRLETQNSFGLPEEPKNLLGSACSSSSGLTSNDSKSLKPLLPHAETQKTFMFSDEARRLADVIAARHMIKRMSALAAIERRLDMGTTPAELELHVLLWSAFCLIGPGRKSINNAGRWIVKQIDDGETAARNMREVMAAWKPDESDAYTGYLADGSGQHPDLARVDELIGQLDTRSYSE